MRAVRPILTQLEARLAAETAARQQVRPLEHAHGPSGRADLCDAPQVEAKQKLEAQVHKELEVLRAAESTQRAQELVFHRAQTEIAELEAEMELKAQHTQKMEAQLQQLLAAGTGDKVRRPACSNFR
jgi:hypothetical protein